MENFVESFLAADAYTWSVVMLMAFLFTAFVTSSMGNYLYSILFYPGFMVGGLLASWLSRSYDFYIVPDRSIRVIIETALGMGASLVLLLLGMRLFMVMYSMTIRPQSLGTRARAVTPR